MELKATSSYGERSPEYYFQPAITWSDLSSTRNAFRLSERGCLYDGRGPGAFPLNDQSDEISMLLGVLNSNVAYEVLQVLNPYLKDGGKQVDNSTHQLDLFFLDGEQAKFYLQNKEILNSLSKLLTSVIA
jgi:hypothetical protein